MLQKIALLSVSTLALAACLDQDGGRQCGARNEIRIVGSSTVFAFAKAVAKKFSAGSTNTSPNLQSTCTSGGMNLFCASVSANTPDIANASRRMKASDLEMCHT